MIASEDLFTLIKSLTKSEKKYFKQHATLYIREGGNTYLQLFDALNNQKEYDEKELVKQFHGCRFTKQFSVAKNFLHNKILASLESYHNSIYTEVRSLIHRTEILYEKGLYKHANKVIRKAKKIATLYEMHHALLEISHNWESNIALKQMNAKLHIKILEDGKKSLGHIANDLHYASLSAKFVEHYFDYGKTKKSHHLKKMDAMIQNPFLQDESKAITFRSKVKFYEAHLFYYSALSDEKGMYKFTKKLALLFDPNPEKIKQYLVNYMVNLNNLVSICIALKKLDEIPIYLEKLKFTETLIKNKFLKERFFIWYTSCHLSYNNKKGFFSRITGQLPEIISGLNEYEKTLQNIEKATVYSDIAVSFFAESNYNKCLHWLNKIRDELSLTVNPDFQTENKIFYLIVHFEMKNMELIPYLVQSLYRFLIKKERQLQFEKLIIRFLEKQSAITDGKELIASFKELINQIKSLPEEVSFSHFDFVSWLESKIGSRSFAEVVREKAKFHLR